MKEFTYKLTDPVGIHARPAGILVKQVSGYSSSVTIEANGKTADAKKIFSIMSLGAKGGNDIKFIISGPDEDKAYDEVKKFVEENL